MKTPTRAPWEGGYSVGDLFDAVSPMVSSLRSPKNCALEWQIVATMYRKFLHKLTNACNWCCAKIWVLNCVCSLALFHPVTTAAYFQLSEFEKRENPKPCPLPWYPMYFDPGSRMGGLLLLFLPHGVPHVEIDCCPRAMLLECCLCSSHTMKVICSPIHLLIYYSFLT